MDAVTVLAPRVVPWSAALAVGLSFLAAGGGCGPKRFVVALVYDPTSDLDVGAVSDVPTIPVSIDVADRRTEGEQVGVNLEEEDDPVPVLAEPGTTVSGFVREAMSKELSEMGLNVVESGGQRHLAVEVLKLWVREENTYKGELRVRVRVLDSSGAERANLVGTGAASRWGSSMDEENYQETLSDCVVDVIQNLVKEGNLLAALR